MTIVKKAVIKHLKDAEPPVLLSLFRIERGVFRWINDFTGDQAKTLAVDYLTEDDALRALRVRIDHEPEWVGWDLTISPVADPPEVRAAKRIVKTSASIAQAHLIGGGEGDLEADACDAIALIIQQETGIAGLVEAVNLLIAYEFPRLRQPKRGGLDLTHGGLLVDVLTALEQVQQTDLSNLKAKLVEGVERMEAYARTQEGGGEPPKGQGGRIQ